MDDLSKAIVERLFKVSKNTIKEQQVRRQIKAFPSGGKNRPQKPL